RAAGETAATSRSYSQPNSVQLRRLPQNYALYEAPNLENTATNSNSNETRLSFGHFNSPIGAFSLVSRELDQYGHVRSVDLLTFDDPNSPWDMDVKVNDGAMFEIKRHSGGGSSSRTGPLAGTGKALPPDLH